MECDSKKLISAAVIAGGLVLGGFFPGWYYYQAKINTNTVVVKGLAEMDVKADLAIWRIKFTTTNDDLMTAQQIITSQAEKIKQFLVARGFSQSEINIKRIETNDLMANPYRGNDAASSRFILSQTIMVKTANVDLVEKTLPETNALIADGIVFENSYGEPVSYIFTRLNKIKPKMLEEATQNAKQAAAEFAKNSGSHVGKIKYANQEIFSILPAEEIAESTEAQQINKKVRVVSTIEYRLD